MRDSIAAHLIFYITILLQAMAFCRRATKLILGSKLTMLLNSMCITRRPWGDVVRYSKFRDFLSKKKCHKKTIMRQMHDISNNIPGRFHFTWKISLAPFKQY